LHISDATSNFNINMMKIILGKLTKQSKKHATIFSCFSFATSNDGPHWLVSRSSSTLRGKALPSRPVNCIP
jgi:hypothetical protein